MCVYERERKRESKIKQKQPRCLLVETLSAQPWQVSASQGGHVTLNSFQYTDCY